MKIVISASKQSCRQRKTHFLCEIVTQQRGLHKTIQMPRWIRPHAGTKACVNGQIKIPLRSPSQTTRDEWNPREETKKKPTVNNWNVIKQLPWSKGVSITIISRHSSSVPAAGGCYINKHIRQSPYSTLILSHFKHNLNHTARMKVSRMTL